VVDGPCRSAMGDWKRRRQVAGDRGRRWIHLTRAVHSGVPRGNSQGPGLVAMEQQRSMALVDRRRVIGRCDGGWMEIWVGDGFASREQFTR
jgi:hypothetical protein